MEVGRSFKINLKSFIFRNRSSMLGDLKIDRFSYSSLIFRNTSKRKGFATRSNKTISRTEIDIGRYSSNFRKEFVKGIDFRSIYIDKK